MHRETVKTKISLLLNLEKTNMNPLHTHTIHISQFVNIHKHSFFCAGVLIS